ncbi:hypothetical protein ACP70R_040243 [Stipagrostis hirtigluma subsp. patula]
MDTPNTKQTLPANFVVPDSQSPYVTPNPRPLAVLSPQGTGHEIVPVPTPHQEPLMDQDSIFYDFEEVKHKDKCLMPVTLAMVRHSINVAGAKPLAINRAEVSTVRVVGRVIDIKIYDIKATFLIDDGTSTIDGNYWLAVDNWASDEFSKISNGNYANIVGRIVRNEGSVYIQVFSCRKIHDYNEVTNHFLYVIKAHLDLCGKTALAV